MDNKRIVVKLICIIWIAGLLWGTLHALVTSKLCYAFGSGCIDVPFGIVLVLSIMLLYGVYLMVIGCNLFDLFAAEPEKKIPIPTINIDLIKSQDYEWIKEIKNRHKNKQKMIAKSKNGAPYAKRKAKQLGIEECFVAFEKL